jgi:predicted NACHT family NTPase
MEQLGNPLLLALTCNLDSKGNLKTSTTGQIVESWTRLLLHQWDDSRLFTSPRFNQARSISRRALQHIALLIAEEKLPPVIPEKILTSALIEFIRYRIDADDELVLAHDLIEFTTQRAGLLITAGTSSAGEPLFRFQHDIFREYLAACEAVRTTNTPEFLAETVAKHLHSDTWQSIAELASSVVGERTFGGSERYLTKLKEVSLQAEHDDPGMRQLLHHLETDAQVQD